VRIVIDQDVEHFFRARITDGHCDLRCSIFGAEVTWAAAFAYVMVHKHFKESRDRDLIFADHQDTESLPQLLEFAFDRRVTERSERPWPVHLPAPTFPDANRGIDYVDLARELWLCAIGWILHHELAHIRLGHLEKTLADLDDEVAADNKATEWVLGGLEDEEMKVKRSLGMAIAVVLVAGLSLHRDSRAAVGRRTHPPAGERILRALSHPSFADNHPAQEFACVAVKIHLDRFGIQAPAGAFETVSESLSAYCRQLIDWELRRT